MIAHRPFTNYAEYVYKQGGKARGRRDHLLRHLDKNTESFARAFRLARPHLRYPGSILCLGARTGAESLGAGQTGFDAVGMDLHPVGPTVIAGDWHDLQFSNASFDNVYSNSLDHCLYLDQLTAGVTRVLKPNGRFYVMASNREGQTVEAWQAKWSKSNEGLFWHTSDDLRDAICGFGFTVTKEWRDGKWGHYVFSVR